MNNPPTHLFPFRKGALWALEDFRLANKELTTSSKMANQPYLKKDSELFLDSAWMAYFRTFTGEFGNYIKQHCS